MTTLQLNRLPPLDAHAHLPTTTTSDLCEVHACVLAMAISLEEASLTSTHTHPHIAWGVGCHPRQSRSQASFDVNVFLDVAKNRAIVGEIGLDAGSRVPLSRQLHTFRSVLSVVADMPRILSIHSYRATGLVLKELQRIPVAAPILHWWTGTASETSEAVELGCFFSIHSAVARHSKFRTRVPPERILVESDHGYRDPPAAIACRIEWVEHLVAKQLGLDVANIRELMWRNLARIAGETETENLLPTRFAAILTTLEGPRDTPRLL
jgi:TatD DNase family protein